MIPQQPDEKIPAHFCLKTFPCQEKYGYVWVCLSQTAIAAKCQLSPGQVTTILKQH
ncbi:MAG: hypothetical protein ACKN9E_15925 [Microcystaceae cyanobacterium]